MHARATLLLVTTAIASATAQNPGIDRDEGTRILQKACIKCHGSGRAKGGFDLEAALTNPRPETQLFVWQKARAMIEARGMPPRRPLSDAHATTAAEHLRSLEALALRHGGGPGFEPTRRLTRFELQNSLRDLLGHEPDLRPLLPAELTVHGGFEASSGTLFTHPVWLDRAMAAIDLAVATAIPDAGRPSLPGWSEQKGPESLAVEFAHRAWRRPLGDEDVAALTRRCADLARESRSSRAVLRDVVREILCAPDFLMRVEAPTTGTEIQAVSPYGMASRLSFFLWSSVPDTRLLELAANGSLNRPEILVGEVHRMLEDPRSLAFARSFSSQWLGYDGLGTRIKPDPIDSPFMTDSVMASMREEVAHFVHDLVRKDRPFAELLNGRRAYVNAELARFYRQRSMTRSESPEWVEHRDPQRFGILGRAAILASTSHPDRTSPVLRGTWVLERILGMPPPPPPPGAGEFEEDVEEQDELSFREKLALHREKTQCAACHDKIDPLGLALEGFDRFGRKRRADTTGRLPDGTRIDGVRQLRRVLLKRHGTDIANEACRRMLAYALGRALTWEDERTARELAAVLQQGGWRDAVEAVVLSRPFREIDPAAGGPR